MKYHIAIWLFFIVMSLTIWLLQRFSVKKDTLYVTANFGWLISLYGIAFSILAGIVKLFLKLLGF